VAQGEGPEFKPQYCKKTKTVLDSNPAKQKSTESMVGVEVRGPRREASPSLDPACKETSSFVWTPGILRGKGVCRQSPRSYKGSGSHESLRTGADNSWFAESDTLLPGSECHLQCLVDSGLCSLQSFHLQLFCQPFFPPLPPGVWICRFGSPPHFLIFSL
jgi:hypothetical protein